MIMGVYIYFYLAFISSAWNGFCPLLQLALQLVTCDCLANYRLYSAHILIFDNMQRNVWSFCAQGWHSLFVYLMFFPLDGY